MDKDGKAICSVRLTVSSEYFLCVNQLVYSFIIEGGQLQRIEREQSEEGVAGRLQYG